MKTIQELRKNSMDENSGNVFVISRVKDLYRRKFDFDVFLPSKNKNLQRKYIWTIEQQREIIMSIIYKRYIPIVYILSLINRDDLKSLEDTWQVIDGKQRIISMMKFYNNEFTIILEGKEYYFKDLPNDYQLEIGHYNINGKMVYDKEDRTFTDQEKLDWFKMINFSGTPQDAEHMKQFE